MIRIKMVKDEIPLTSMGMNDLRNSILPAFGVLRREHVVKDGEVVIGSMQPEYKEYLEYMNRLWDEGLVDNSSYSQTIEQKAAKGNDGKIGMFMDALPFLTLGDSEPIHP